MTIEDRIKKLKSLITCMECELSGKGCDENCPTQYEAGNMGEIKENLEAISEILEKDKGLKLRTKGEQKAYLDGYEMCAECIEKYLSDEGKKQLECLLTAVRNAVEIEDVTESEEENVKTHNNSTGTT